MKKQRRQAPKKRKATKQESAENAAPQNRRDVLKLLRNAAIATPVIGIAGYVTATRVQASICELDLSKIGDGVPSVVQVHDPQCNLCATLQRQTRRALRPYDDDDHHFLIANLSTLEGQTFARLHGAGQVTLVLFDEQGQRVGVIRGPLDDAALADAIAAHLGPI